MTKTHDLQLTWKFEDGGGASADDDIGPAWVEGRPQSGSYPTGPVFGGRWISRREARAIAEDNRLAFFEDDGRCPSSAPRRASGLDIAEINRKLVASGVSKSALRIEDSGFGDIKLWGTMLQSLPRFARDPDSPITTAMVSMSRDEAVDALDQLVPGWRAT